MERKESADVRRGGKRVIPLATIAGLAGAILGALIAQVGNSILEEQRRSLSTKRDQLQHFYAPLEVLTRLNEMEFERYFDRSTTDADRHYIETHIWHPNNTKIQSIVLENAHLLDAAPDTAIMKMLQHINVWLSEYELVYVKKEKAPPVFAGTRGYGWPTEVDTLIAGRAAQLRIALKE